MKPFATTVRCCKDCNERHKNCHSHCERYLKEKEEVKKKNEWLKQNNHSIGDRAYDKHIPTLIENPKKMARKKR